MRIMKMRIMKTVLVLLTLLALWLGTSWYATEQILAIGETGHDEALELKMLSELNVPGLQRRSVEIYSGTVVLAGSLYEHPATSGCAIVLVPGIGGNRNQILPVLPILWPLGCDLLAYDPRGTGGSSNVPRTFGFHEKKDNAAVIRWLAEHNGIDTTRIGVWGPSFGAAVGILTLEEIDALAFVVADSPFSSLRRAARDAVARNTNAWMASALLPAVLYFLELRTGLSAADVRPEQAIAGVKTPVLIIHAVADPDMDVSHSQAIFAARTTDNVELRITDWGAGHADSALVDPAAYAALIRSFLVRHHFVR